MFRCALGGLARRAGRVRPAAGLQAVLSSADFAERKERLLAEIGYQTQFRPEYSTGPNSYEAGLVAGAGVVRRLAAAAAAAAAPRLTPLLVRARSPGRTTARCG
jgi:hypothetical protein